MVSTMVNEDTGELAQFFQVLALLTLVNFLWLGVCSLTFTDGAISPGSCGRLTCVLAG